MRSEHWYAFTAAMGLLALSAASARPNQSLASARRAVEEEGMSVGQSCAVASCGTARENTTARVESRSNIEMSFVWCRPGSERIGPPIDLAIVLGRRSPPAAILFLAGRLLDRASAAVGPDLAPGGL